MKNKNVLYLCQGAMIAALYVVLCLVFEPISFGAIQCRIAEALTILPCFTPAAIPGVTIGCFISNLIGGGSYLDVIFGTLATLIGALGTYWLRRNVFLAPVPPILSNTIIIPLVLRFAYFDASPFYFLAFTVGIGEVLSCGILGLMLYFVVNRQRSRIFPLTLRHKD